MTMTATSPHHSSIWWFFLLEGIAGNHSRYHAADRSRRDHTRAGHVPRLLLAHHGHPGAGPHVHRPFGAVVLGAADWHCRNLRGYPGAAASVARGVHRADGDRHRARRAGPDHGRASRSSADSPAAASDLSFSASSTCWPDCCCSARRSGRRSRCRWCSACSC